MHYIEYNVSAYSTTTTNVQSVSTLHLPLPLAKTYRWLTLPFHFECFTGGGVGWASLTSGGNSSKSSYCSETMGVTGGGLLGLLSSWSQAFSWSTCFLTVRPSFKVIRKDTGPVCCLTVPSIHFGPFPVLCTKTWSDTWKLLGLAWVSWFLFCCCWLLWPLLAILGCNKSRCDFGRQCNSNSAGEILVVACGVMW